MSLLIHDDPVQRFDKITKLGEGTYGVVYQAWDRQENRFVALKKIRMCADDEGIASTTMREIAILRGLNHTNVVRLFNVIYSNHKLTMVFEFLEQDLKHYMDNHRNYIDPAIVRTFLEQLLAGLVYCHSHRVLHRDIKPQNLLIDPTRHVLKLCDFGLARTFSVPGNGVYTREVVTLWYRPPEILLGNQNYSTPSDIWPSGCILAEMLEKRPLFPGDAEIDQLFRIFRFFFFFFLSTVKEQWELPMKLFGLDAPCSVISNRCIRLRLSLYPFTKSYHTRTIKRWIS